MDGYCAYRLLNKLFCIIYLLDFVITIVFPVLGFIRYLSKLFLNANVNSFLKRVRIEFSIIIFFTISVMSFPRINY